MSIKKQAISGVKWTTVSAIVLAISAILKVAILARYLDKEDFGLMALITFVLGFSTLFLDMGLTTAILHKQGISKKEYASLYWLNLFFSLAIFALIVSISPFVSSFYNEQELTVLIPLAAVNILLSGVGRQFKTIEQKKLKFKTIAIIDIISAISSLIYAVILALNGYGVYSLVYASILQFAVNNLLFLIIGLKSMGLLFHFNFKDVRPFLKIGVFQVGGQVINYFNRDLDILIIGKYFGSEILGGYSLAKQLVQRPAMIINPILTRVASPVLARYQSDINKLKTNYLLLVNVVSTIAIPIYIGIILFAPYVIYILYGSDYENISTIVRILCVYMMFRAIGNPQGSLVIATGKTALGMLWNLITLPIIAIALIIGAMFSIEGLTLSLMASAFFLFIPNWWIMIRRMTNASLKEYTLALIPFKKSTLKYFTHK